MENISTDSPQNNGQQILEIKTVEEMSNYLETLQYNASSSVSNALSAQLQVVRYVSSPDLTNSTFDLLFKNLDLSLKSAEDEEEKCKMRELSQLMIHNYIFFANAKLEYSIAKNKEAGEEVLKDATRELLKSTATVIGMAEKKIAQIANKALNMNDGVNAGISPLKTAENQVKGLMGITGTVGTEMGMSAIAPAAAVFFAALVAKDFIEKITKENGIWDKAMDWTFASFKNKKDKENFILTIDGIVNKLDKYYTIIGKSNLMSDVIDRYSDNLVKLKTQHLESEAKGRARIYRPILVVLTIFASISLSAAQLMNKGYNGVKNLVMKNEAVAETHYLYYWLCLLALVLLGYLWILIPKFQLNSKVRASEQKYKLLSQKFLEV